MVNHRDGDPPWIPCKMRAWREWANINLTEMAEIVGMNIGYLSDVETGWRRYNQDVLDKYAARLNIPSGWLLDRDPPAGRKPFNVKRVESYVEEMVSLDEKDQMRVAAYIRSLKEISSH
jgi:transcriptional regulator with XRE-family HTH domain